MVAMGITKALDCGADSNSTSDYSMFAFLYGTFPTAPSVFIYSAHYGVAMDLVSCLLFYIKMYYNIICSASCSVAIDSVSCLLLSYKLCLCT